MKLFTILLFLAVFVFQINSQTQEYVYEATDDNYCDEPEPTGGKLCTKDSECNENAKSRFDGNKCDLSSTSNTTTKTSAGLRNVTVGKCECALDYTMKDCSHERYNKDLAGGLQFLCFIGVGGVGNFIADRITPGVLQLLMLLSAFLFVCVMFCAMCCEMANDSSSDSEDCMFCGSGILSCLMCLTIFGGLVWCIVDAVQFLGGDLVDGSGYYPYNAGCTFVQG